MDVAKVGRGWHGLVGVLAGSGAVFAVTSVIAARGYPSWMWWFVMAGLVLPPVVAVVAVVAWTAHRLAQS